MASEYKEISLSRLLLDHNNPRHQPMASQAEIIAYLIEHEDIKVLANNIVKKKGLNPYDNIGVMLLESSRKSPRYIVLEGNRRICALKLLQNPRLAPANQQKYFERLSTKYDKPITKVYCHVSQAREEAKDWIAGRHGDSKDGEGIKRWDALQSSRFFEKPENALALTILQFVVEHGLLPAEKAQKKMVTTISRMMSTPETRKGFGIVSPQRSGEVLINVPIAEFKIAIEQYLHDIDNENLNVGSRSHSTDRRSYITELQRMGKLPLTNLISPINLLTGKTVNSENAEAAAAQPTNTDSTHGLSTQNAQQQAEHNQSDESNTPAENGSNPTTITPHAADADVRGTRSSSRDRDRSKDTKLIIQQFSIPSAKIKAIYLELKNKLNVQETPYAAAALLRALIELSCDYYLYTNKQPRTFNDGGKSYSVSESSPLRIKILGLAQHFLTDSSCEFNDKEFATLKNECQEGKSNEGGLNLLHSILHNYTHAITPDRVIAAHDNFVPLLKAIWSK